MTADGPKPLIIAGAIAPSGSSDGEALSPYADGGAPTAVALPNAANGGVVEDGYGGMPAVRGASGWGKYAAKLSSERMCASDMLPSRRNSWGQNSRARSSPPPPRMAACKQGLVGAAAPPATPAVFLPPFDRLAERPPPLLPLQGLAAEPFLEPPPRALALKPSPIASAAADLCGSSTSRWREAPLAGMQSPGRSPERM